jgi:hypothetical protein
VLIKIVTANRAADCRRSREETDDRRAAPVGEK